MIGMGTTKIITGREIVMSDFAVCAFAVIGGGMAIFTVGALVAVVTFIVKSSL
jgi:hypothetical protein